VTLQRYVSDELTHFLGRSLASDADGYDLLVQIVGDGELRPSELSPGSTVHTLESLSSNRAVQIQAVAFVISLRAIWTYMSESTATSDWATRNGSWFSKEPTLSSTLLKTP
jgi:hypothetical protein